MAADPAADTAGSFLLTYVAPFAGALLVAIGIPGAILGGYVPVQDALGLCGDPAILVSSPAATERLTAGTGQPPVLHERDFGDLSPAEQRAFTEALAAPTGEGTVAGAFPNREAFLDGVVVTYQGGRYYATVASLNDCVGIDPLVLPLGLTAILLGVLGLLTPPIYRKMAAIESR